MNTTLLNAKQLAEKLNISVRQIRRMDAAKQIPGRVNLPGTRIVRWDSQIVEKWIADKCPPVKR